MNVLVIGRGGREHALAWKLRQDGHEVFVAPGNLNMGDVTCVPIEETDVSDLVEFAKREAVDWTIVGPESALMAGVVDVFQAQGQKIFGPTKAAALLEGSKAFAKEVMREANIPTAGYDTFTDAESALRHIDQLEAPLVVKADGLAAGKGVTVAFTLEEARAAIHDIFDTDKFGDQSRVVIEEFLDGEEFSLMAFVSGEHVIPMITSQDHKRAYDGDAGPNTGGMGAYSPMPHLDDVVYKEAVERVLFPLARTMVERGTPFEGFLYAGLILTADGPKVIEFNARFGDPETEVILPNLASSLLGVIEAVVDRKPYCQASATCQTMCSCFMRGRPGTGPTSSVTEGDCSSSRRRNRRCLKRRRPSIRHSNNLICHRRFTGVISEGGRWLRFFKGWVNPSFFSCEKKGIRTSCSTIME